MNDGVKSAFRIEYIALDDATLHRAPEIEQESGIAIYDLLEENFFQPQGSPGGPYHVFLAMEEDRLMLDVRLNDGAEHGRMALPLTPLRRVIKDYRALCESYYSALHEAPARLEAIDMGRRGLHDEGSALLRERLTGKIEMDFPTARRLFTLISVLHMKG